MRYSSRRTRFFNSQSARRLLESSPSGVEVSRESPKKSVKIGKNRPSEGLARWSVFLGDFRPRLVATSLCETRALSGLAAREKFRPLAEGLTRPLARALTRPTFADVYRSFGLSWETSSLKNYHPEDSKRSESRRIEFSWKSTTTVTSIF